MDVKLLSVEKFSLLSQSPLYNKHMNLLRDAVCKNQGWIIEYSYLSSEKHKKIKDELRKESPDLEALREYYKKLIDYLKGELKRVCQENFKFLLEYFKNRSWIEPRICIKVYNDENIITLCRDRTSIPNKEYPLNTNTAFGYIYQTGRYYICTDIPTKFKNREYKNERIIEQNAVRYDIPSWFKKKYNKYFKNPDEKWINCWFIPKDKSGNNMPLSPDVCYKSTLVIPMTLYNNLISEELRQRFGIQELSPKSIYGFLCFDHHELDFFNEKEDLCMGYIFADILSLYLIYKLIYTEYSYHFKSARKKIKEAD